MPKEQDLNHLGTKLSQLLADTIIHAAPHVQQKVQEARADANHDFLEGLEQHTANLVGPMLKSVAATGSVPPELLGLLEELGVPTEQYTGIISQFFVFGVMFQLAGAMLAPFVQQVNNDVWSAHPDRPLSPPDIATAVVRGFSLGDAGGTTVPDWATAMAAENGFNAEVFATMVGVTGMAPALQLLFEMVRRQIIPEGELNGGGQTLISGIQQSDIRDEWIEYVSKLRYVQPTPTDLVAAAVRHQTDELEDGVDLSYWQDWATTLGLEPPAYLADNPNWFAMLYNISGRPPGPQEMARLANRGQLEWSGTGSTTLSFQQGIAESDIKDKWYGSLVKLAQYWPAVGEVGALLREGGISETQAETYWRAEGVPSELLAALKYVNTIQQVTQDKALAKGDIVQLLQENAITDQEALVLLAEVGYTGDNAEYLIESAHFRYELAALRRSVETIGTNYVKRGITATQANEGLQGLGMPEAQITQLLETLTNQRNAEVLIPTVAQMASAYYYGIVNYETALDFLVSQGYSVDNAWLVLSVRMHAPIQPTPTGVPEPPALVTPATTSTATTTTTPATTTP